MFTGANQVVNGDLTSNDAESEEAPWTMLGVG